MKKTVTFLFVLIAFFIKTNLLVAQDLEGVVKSTDLQVEPYSKWYFEYFEIAHPNDAVLARTRDLLNEKKIVVVFGTWCKDSKMWVPYFFRMLDLMQYDPSKVLLIAVNRDKKARDMDLSKYKIERVPTFIIYDKNENELGRIVETPRYSLEEDLLEILKNNAKE